MVKGIFEKAKIVSIRPVWFTCMFGDLILKLLNIPVPKNWKFKTIENRNYSPPSGLVHWHVSLKNGTRADEWWEREQQALAEMRDICSDETWKILEKFCNPSEKDGFAFGGRLAGTSHVKELETSYEKLSQEMRDRGAFPDVR